MIGKVVRGMSFRNLARYLETAKGPGERVAWVEARNLATDDPRAAAGIMRATAGRSVDVRRPVYHLSISWEPGEEVSRATMVGVADRLLKELGVWDHQALLVAHGDTRHPHLHVMLNRVREDGRVWKGWNDYRAIERSLREQERELGLREVPGHHGRLPGQEPPDRGQALSSGELRQWERTGRVPFVELVREVAGKDFARARSWTDLESRLARYGLRVEPRGRGLVVTDGREYAKCSAVARESSRAGLERRFGERYLEHIRDVVPAREHADRDGRDPAVEQVRSQVEQLERRVGHGRERARAGQWDLARESGPTSRQLRHALGHAIMRLTPVQVQRLQQMLTSPQRTLAAQAVRTANALLLEQDRER